MTTAITSALGGVSASAAQFDKAAKNVVKAAAPGSADDLAGAIVDTKESELSYKANLSVFKNANKMMGDLLDIMA